MEVHKHPHHVTHTKKWPEYLLEFLMLFLAVFLGFLAENFREHLVDARKEKQYMYSLVQDVNDDIQNMNYNLELGEVVREKLDSAIYIMNEEEVNDHVIDFYRLGGQAGRIVGVSFNNRTSLQLKNSGSMQLVRDPNLSDSIRSYWKQIELDEEISTRMVEQQKRIGDIGIQVFNNKYYKTDRLNPMVTFVSSDARLVNNDPKLIIQLANSANIRLVILDNYLINLQDTKAQALRLIDLIKREYHFK